MVLVLTLLLQTVDKTFSSMKFWVNEVDKYANENTRKYVVGNKNDLNPAVPVADARVCYISLKTTTIFAPLLLLV